MFNPFAYPAIKDFDQVVAISQRCINDSLDRRYNESYFADDFTFDRASPTLKCALRAGVRNLCAQLVDRPNRQDHAIIQFDLTATPDGDAPVFTWNRGTADEQTAQVQNSRLAFAAHFGLRQNASLPAALRRRVDQAGRYNMSQLYIDFSAAGESSFQESLSDIKGFAGRDAGRAVFLAALMRYLEEKTRENLTIIGCQTVATAAAGPSATYQSSITCPPTAVSLQIAAHDRDEDKNAFLLAEACENRPLPSTELPSANWVFAGSHGSMTVARRVFWHRLVWPEIAQSSRWIYWILDGCFKTADVVEQTRGRPGWCLTAPHVTNPADDMPRQPLKDAKFTGGLGQASTFEQHGGYAARDWKLDFHHSRIADDAQYSFSGTHAISTEFDVWATQLVCTNTIRCRWRAEAKGEVAAQISGSMANGEFLTCYRRVTIDVTVDIRVKAVSFGRVQLEVRPLPTEPCPISTNITTGFKAHGGTNANLKLRWDTHCAKYNEWYRDRRAVINQGVTQLTEMHAHLRKQLEPPQGGGQPTDAQRPFILPGGLDFSLKDPTFTHEGNLHCDLTMTDRTRDDAASYANAEKLAGRG